MSLQEGAVLPPELQQALSPGGMGCARGLRLGALDLGLTP